MDINTDSRHPLAATLLQQLAVEYQQVHLAARCADAILLHKGCTIYNQHTGIIKEVIPDLAVVRTQSGNYEGATVKDALLSFYRAVLADADITKPADARPE